jgi:methylmalonyl-CoA mutase N-terminal domain/subunit
MDETLSLPTEQSARLALRTQQIIAEETGVTNTIDPLAGSYFVEALTDRLEAGASEYIRRIDEMGGMIKAIELGFPQKEIAEAAYLYQRQIDDQEKIVVGVNRYTEGDDHKVNLLRIGPEVERSQRERLRRTRADRDTARHEVALQKLEAASRSEENLMPHILEAVHAYASVQEICDTLKKAFGVYRESQVQL